MHFYSQYLGGKRRQISESEASLVYRASSRTALATQRNPFWRKNKTKLSKKKTTTITLRKEEKRKRKKERKKKNLRPIAEI